MKKKILISTGGSGGHVIPATTIYDHLKTEYDVVISTDVRGIKYLDSDAYKFFVVDTPKLKKSILLPFIILKIFLLTLRSLFLLKKKKNSNFNFNRRIYVITFMFSCKNTKY